MNDKIILNQNRKYRMLCFALAGLIALFTFSVVIIFMLQEARELLSEGLSFFILDVLLRVIFGLLIACFGGLPYFIGATAVSKVKHPQFMFATCLGIFFFDIYKRIQVIFFATGSTDAIAIVFMPIVFAFPILIVWGIMILVSKHSYVR